MSAVLLIARRELAGFLRTMSGYVIIAVVLAATGLLFNVEAVNRVQLSGELLARFFYLSSGMVMVASVLISMRLLAEERQTGTLALLYSSPVRDGEIVAGKFLSALAFLALLLLCTAFMPALIMLRGKVSAGHVAVGYAGLLLLGSACLALGTLGSALARSQLVAGVVSGSLVLLLLLAWLLGRATEAPLSDVFASLALWQQHFGQSFMLGLVRTRDVAYYLGVTWVALFAATRVLEARRWR
jgi:ABC-2 type transport system permease protein